MGGLGNFDPIFCFKWTWVHRIDAYNTQRDREGPEPLFFVSLIFLKLLLKKFCSKMTTSLLTADYSAASATRVASTPS